MILWYKSLWILIITNTIICVKDSNQTNKHVDVVKESLDKPELSMSGDYIKN